MACILRIKNVYPILTKDYPTKAKRPLNSRLDTSKIREVFNLDLTSWEKTLAKD